MTTCVILYSVQAHQICERLHSMDLSEMRGKTIAKVSSNCSPAMILVSFISFIEKKERANWPLTCRRKYQIKMIKQMQMARHKLTSYILYVSKLVKTLSKTLIDSRVVQVKFNLQCWAKYSLLTDLLNFRRLEKSVVGYQKVKCSRYWQRDYKKKHASDGICTPMLLYSIYWWPRNWACALKVKSVSVFVWRRLNNIL